MKAGLSFSRLNQGTNEPTNPRGLVETRRDIAGVKTGIHQRELARAKDGEGSKG